jgi:outer membrane protein
MDLLPEIHGSSSLGLSKGRSVDPATNDIIDNQFFNTSMGLYSSVSVFRGFIMKNRMDFANHRSQAAKWQTIMFEDDLAFDIMMTYYDAVYYYGMIDIAKEQVELSEYSLEKTKALVHEGLKPPTDITEMQAVYEKEKLNLLQANNRVAEVKHLLGQKMNLPPQKLYQLEFNVIDTSGFIYKNESTEAVYQQFSEKSPFLKTAQAELAAKTVELKMVKGRYSPSIVLNASVTTGYYETNVDDNGIIIPFQSQFDQNLNQYIGASVRIPVFNRFQIKNDAQKAKLAINQAQLQMENSQQQLYYEIANNNRQLEAYYMEKLQAEKQLQANEQAYQAAQKKYDEGLIDIIELLTVKNRLSEIKSQLLFAQLQWEIKSKTMEFYKGNRFWK